MTLQLSSRPARPHLIRPKHAQGPMIAAPLALSLIFAQAGIGAAADVTTVSTPSGSTHGALVNGNVPCAIAANEIGDCGKAAPAGALVGTTDVQTLSNKSISGSANILANIPDSALSANVDLLNGSQILTGLKTFAGGATFSSSGTITLPDGSTWTSSGLTATAGTLFEAGPQFQQGWHLTSSSGGAYNYTVSGSASVANSAEYSSARPTGTVPSGVWAAFYDSVVDNGVNYQGTSVPAGRETDYSCCNTGATQGRAALQGKMNYNNANGAQPTGNGYIGVNGLGTATANAGGQAGPDTGYWGDIFGVHGLAICGNGCTFFHGAFNEMDVDVTSTSAPVTVASLLLSDQPDHATHGFENDGQLILAHQIGGVGFNNGILFGTTLGSNQKFPVDSTGTVIGIGAAATVSYGIDFWNGTHNLTCAVFCFRSNGFVVDGFGNEVASSLVLGSPTGGAEGSGAINAQAIYLNGVPVGTGNGTITATGAPASGNLARFSSGSSITNGDFVGDCTTSGTLTITCTKTNGAAFGTAAVQSIGTVGAVLCPLNANCTWTNTDTLTFPDGTNISSSGVTFGQSVTMGAHQISGATNVSSANGSGYELASGAASSTKPTLLPTQGSTTTGWGANSSGAIDGINGGTDVFRLGSGSHAYAIGFGTASTTESGYLCYNSGSSPANELLLDTVGCTSSLRSLKMDIHPIDPSAAVSELMKLSPIWYRWNQKTHPTAIYVPAPDPRCKANEPCKYPNIRKLVSKGDLKSQPGLIAEDVQKVDNRLAAYDSHNKLKGVRYEQMTAFLVAAIQAQQKEIAGLRKELTALKPHH